MRHRMSEISWERFRDLVPATTDLALVPVGTLEAHGAVPLGTDTIIPEKLASDLAPRLGGLIAPAVAYGVTNSLLPYPGSTTVSSATFRAYLFEACAGLVDTGFRRIVLLNGHGGQSAEVADVVARLWNEKKAFAASVEWWGFVEEASRAIYGEHTSGHAGVEETAMVIAADPGLVDPELLAGARRAPRRAGLRARPFPATIILDRPERDGDGAPVADRASAFAFYAACLLEIDRALRDVFEGWDALRSRR